MDKLCLRLASLLGGPGLLHKAANPLGRRGCQGYGSKEQQTRARVGTLNWYGSFGHFGMPFKATHTHATSAHAGAQPCTKTHLHTPAHAQASAHTARAQATTSAHPVAHL